VAEMGVAKFAEKERHVGTHAFQKTTHVTRVQDALVMDDKYK
jgi:hypothetical protein